MGKYNLFGLVLLLLLVLLQHGDSLKMEMKLIHRHSMHSPLYTHFSSRYQAIQVLITLDSLRISSHYVQSNSHIRASASPPTASNLGENTAFKMPVASGATLGTALYFVELYVGTPPQKILPVADTGSDLVWVNCKSCQNCASFNPNRSSSLSYVPCYSRECYALSPAVSCTIRPKLACKYTQSYLDGSFTTGPYIHETITLSSTSGKPLKVENVLMGCGYQSNINSGGVLGLGQGPNSFAIQTASLYGGIFSYCLRDYIEPITVKSFLVFGDMIQESELSLLRKPIQYTPILQGASSFYYVGIEEIVINGEKLPISTNAWEMDEFGNGGTIIDSGTSLTYLAEEAYEIILEALNVVITYPRVTTLSPQQFDLCFNISGVSELKFPEFSIVFEGGKTFSPPPENYIIQIEDGDDVRCLGLQPIAGPAPSIIGNLLQQNFFVQYDLQQSLLGFAPADCSVHK